MNACDRLNELVSYHNNVDRKTIKWWQRVFAWTIKATQINAYILFYCHGQKAREELTLNSSRRP